MQSLAPALTALNAPLHWPLLGVLHARRAVLGPRTLDPKMLTLLSGAVLCYQAVSTRRLPDLLDASSLLSRAPLSTETRKPARGPACAPPHAPGKAPAEAIHAPATPRLLQW